MITGAGAQALCLRRVVSNSYPVYFTFAILSNHANLSPLYFRHSSVVMSGNAVNIAIVGR